MKPIHSFPKLTQSMLLSAILYLLLLVQLMAAPATMQTALADTVVRRSEGHTIYTHSNGTNYTYNNGSTTTQLSMDGKITFTEDERDIKSISPGGYFRYSKTTFGNKREIFIRSNSEGVLKREYFVGGNETPYEPEGRQWLQEAIKELLTTTTLGAEDRVKRIYAKSGVKGVLAEIDHLESDHVKTSYYSHLLALPNLKDSEMKSLLGQLGKSVRSDYEKSRILQRIGPAYLQNGKVADEYLTAVNSMSSDYEKARVLSHIIDKGKLSNASFSQVIQAVSRISSDYEQSRILRKVLAKADLTSQAQKEAINVLRSISSDYEKSRLIADLAAKPNYVEDNFNDLLTMVGTINSDYEQSRALAKIISCTCSKLNTKQYLQLLPVVASITSDYEKTKVLISLKPKLPLTNTEVRTEYLKIAKTIRSDHEYRRATEGLL